MFKKHISLIIFVAVQVSSENKYDGGAIRQEWGYITVREHAHMFWWLYYTTANVFNYTERPLIIWLQGGPGMASSGYGNFLELGPLDINYNKKDLSIIQDFNVLFIDSPIGVGYSYVSNNTTKIPNNNREVAKDLVSFLKKFMRKKTEFASTPLYIFGESYGGKMVVEFAYQLQREPSHIQQALWNLKGIGLGNAYISPIHYIRSYASLTFNLGLVDIQGRTRIEKLSKKIENLINKKQFEEAADIESTMIYKLMHEVPGIDVYNIISRTNTSAFPSFMYYVPKFNEIMNSDIKKALKIPQNVEWDFLTNDVYFSLQNDLMRSVTDRIEYLLNETSIKIIIYNGVLDFLVNTAGTRSWINHMNWLGKEEFENAKQMPVEVADIVEGICKHHKNLMLYVIFRAGHSVPVDNFKGFKQMLYNALLADNKDC